MVTEELCADRFSEVPVSEQEKLVSGTSSTSEVTTQGAQCRYHMTGPCDCHRYFPRPGTAEYGC
jgi:hypothetical protein